MKLRIIALLIVVVMLCPVVGHAERSKYLEAALRFLEEDNPFLLRYNEMNGTNVKALCPLGCPYFWGGRHVKSLLKVASPGSSSEYYKTDLKYLYGLDCVGFTRWIDEWLGYEPHPAISQLLNTTQYTENLIRGAKNAAGEDRTAVLRIGDLVVMQHASGGFHVAMYCGTLSFFGYDEDSVPPELIPYLGYPLLIHCTGSSDYYERYRVYLESQNEYDVQPPSGGVIISILDVPLSEATATTPDAVGLTTSDAIDLCVPCFDLEGYHLQITDLTQEKHVRWIRWRVKRST